MPPLAGEAAELHRNNTDVAVVRVNEERLSVLFVDGRARWDFRFLKNSLRRDEGLVGGTASSLPEIVLEAETRRRPVDAGPVLPATLEAVSGYDLVILGDASPELLDDSFLALLDEAVRKNGVEVKPARTEPGGSVQITAMVLDSEGNPLGDSALPISVQGPGGPASIALGRETAGKGNYAGSFTPEEEGHYRFVWRRAGSDETLEAAIDVLRASEERRRPNINRVLLGRIAAASGGEMLALGDLAAIPDRVKAETEVMKVHHEAAVWDNWLVLLVLILAYSLDVGLRRMKGLA